MLTKNERAKLKMLLSTYAMAELKARGGISGDEGKLEALAEAAMAYDELLHYIDKIS